MFELTTPLEVTVDRQHGGWELTFFVWAQVACDTPFRDMLGSIAHLLGQERAIDLVLPPYEEHEDFIEGTLRFRDQTLALYFEHALNYLSLMHADRACLEEVTRSLKPHVLVR